MLFPFIGSRIFSPTETKKSISMRSVVCVCVCVCVFHRVRLCGPMDYIAHQAPWSMGFSRQEYWSGLPFPPPEDLPDPEIEP